jgi:SAM-dependent methyltransferase
LGEYLLEESAAETAAVEGLRRGLEAAGTSPGGRLRLAIYATYRPLWPMAERVPLRDAGAADSFGRLLLRQIVEPREEERLRAEIESLTPVEDPVSRAVRAQYEENPYPRWRRAPGAARPYPLGARLRTLFPHLPPELLPEAPEILIAGCGTGRHAAITARLNPSSRILAIDISRASLAYAARRCGELGIGSVRFAQADLLRLGALGERFDVVECVGVLHHLRDPLAGWRVLRDLLRPGGFMKVALYSETARRSVAAARAFIAERGFQATAEGMRKARAAIAALPEGAPARAVLQSPDFYTLSGCRDLLFHVQEVCFTLERIAAALRDLDLEFLGFEFDDPAVLRAYRAECPGDPAATSLPDWAGFEARHPAAFAGMYQFWMRRR